MLKISSLWRRREEERNVFVAIGEIDTKSIGSRFCVISRRRHAIKMKRIENSMRRASRETEMVSLLFCACWKAVGGLSTSKDNFHWFHQSISELFQGSLALNRNFKRQMNCSMKKLLITRHVRSHKFCPAQSIQSESVLEYKWAQPTIFYLSHREFDNDLCVSPATSNSNSSFVWSLFDKRDVRRTDDLKSGNDSFSAAFIIHSLFKVSVMLFRSLSDEVTCLLASSLSFPSRQTGTSVQTFAQLQSRSFIHSLRWLLLANSLDGQFMCSSRRQERSSRWMIPESGEVSLLNLKRNTKFSHFSLTPDTAESEQHCERNNSESGQSLKVQEFNCLYYSSLG